MKGQMKMNLIPMIITASIIFIILAAITITMFIKVKAKMILKIIATAGTSICAAFLVYTMLNVKTAYEHGMTEMNISLVEMLDCIKNSPVEDSLPENYDELKGAIIIYYKFDCPDCKAIYNELSQKVKDNPNVYWVSSRTEQGKKILEKYPVEKVPTGIYIRKEDFGGEINFTAKVLYKADENEKTVLDKEAIERLLYLQNEKR